MSEFPGTLSLSEIVEQYDTTHARLHRMIRRGVIPADAITREKYKGRQGWRARVAVAALAGILQPKPEVAAP